MQMLSSELVPHLILYKLWSKTGGKIIQQPPGPFSAQCVQLLEVHLLFMKIVSY